VNTLSTEDLCPPGIPILDGHRKEKIKN